MKQILPSSTLIHVGLDQLAILVHVYHIPLEETKL